MPTVETSAPAYQPAFPAPPATNNGFPGGNVQQDPEQRQRFLDRIRSLRRK